MTVRELTEYLKQVAKIETTRHNTAEIYWNAKNKFDTMTPRLMTVSVPTQPTQPKMLPLEPKNTFLSTCNSIMSYCFTFFIGSLPLIFIPLFLGAAYEFTLLGCVSALFFGFIWFSKREEYRNEIDKRNEAVNAKNREAQQIYEQKLAEYKQLSSTYNQRVSDGKAAYSRDMTVFSKNKEETLNALAREYHEADKILKELYAKDIIFEKYRNMVAMTTIYEYFASGRCSSLTGPDGAYNLFESETRQNVVIRELSSINKNLEQIKSNQYVLYTELKKGNEASEQILCSVQSLALSANMIERNTAVTAYCSEVAAACSAARLLL